MKKLLIGFTWGGLLLLLLGLLFGTVGAFTSRASDAAQAATESATQAATPAAPQEVAIKMADGLAIKGTYYTTVNTALADNEKVPAVLLLHQNDGNRQQWDRLYPDLVAHGYNVLAVDQRGFGLTGGGKDYSSLEKDALALMNWLREQPSIDKDRVAVIGASVGSNAALRACAADDKCHAVVALSPGANFMGVQTKDIIENMKNKGVMLVAGQLDGDSAPAVKMLALSVPDSGSVLARLYGGAGSHGKDLLYFPDLSPTIIQWLDRYNKKP